MADYNPFISITYSKNDTIVNRVDDRLELLLLVNETLDHGGVIILKGSPGVGKSTVIGILEGELSKAKNIDLIKEEFTPVVYNKLRNMQNKSGRRLLVILDDFNNIEMLDKLGQQKVIDLIYNMSQNMAIMLIENRDEGVETVFKKQGKLFNKYQLDGLKKEEMKQLIINRLNAVRQTKSDSLDPFTQAEFEKIYKKSEGNSRIALLICSALYDKKINSII